MPDSLELRTLYLSENDLRPLFRMTDAILEVERAFVGRATGKAFDIPRVRTRMPGGHLHILQCGSIELNLVGFKAYYIRPEEHTSLLQLIDRDRGNLVAIMEAHWLGQVRTGAATAVAAKYLARRDAGVIGLFGSGRQATTQLEAICAARKVRKIKVFSRDAARLKTFCDAMSLRLDVAITPATSPEHVVRGSDIIITATRGGAPVFDGRWLEAGQLITAVGVNALDRFEIGIDAVKRADVIVVDSRDVARNESGDLLPAYEQGHIYWENISDLGEVILGRGGRTDDEQVILFESHGMGLQDLYCGAFMLKQAKERGLGSILPFGFHK